MKYFYLLLIAVAFSCSKENDATPDTTKTVDNQETHDNNANTATVYKEWKLEAMHINDNVVPQYAPHFGCLLTTSIWEFKQNGSYNAKNNCDDVEDQVDVPFEIVGNSIFITDVLGRTPGIIHNLTAGDFSVTMNDSIVLSTASDGTVISTAPLTITYDLKSL